jgi:hypothetical protein
LISYTALSLPVNDRLYYVLVLYPPLFFPLIVLLLFCVVIIILLDLGENWLNNMSEKVRQKTSKFLVRMV